MLELAKRMPDVQFLVAGTHEAVTDIPPNVTLLGRLAEQTLLAQYYATGDVTLLTSKRETFSMVAAESLCCGTPVVGFQAGGPESIALPEFSAFVPQGDLDALEREVRHTLSESADHAAISKAGIAVYSSQAMCTAYQNVYEELLNASGKTL